MKSLKITALLAAGMFLTLATKAQSQNMPSDTGRKSTTTTPAGPKTTGVTTSTDPDAKNVTKTNVRKEKTKTITKPDGTVVEKTKVKPTNKKDVSKTKPEEPK